MEVSTPYKISRRSKWQLTSAELVCSDGEIVEELKMVDPKKSADAMRKIQDIQKAVAVHESNISRVEREKSERVRYYDQQIRAEQDRIRQYRRQIDDLKRQI